MMHSTIINSYIGIKNILIKTPQKTPKNKKQKTCSLRGISLRLTYIKQTLKPLANSWSLKYILFKNKIIT